MTATGPALAPLAHPITAKWLVREGWRLDAAPFLSGKVEALQALEKLPTQRLADLTKGYEGGIYRRPQHNRHWVTDPKYGVPYIGSSDMLLADLSRLPLLRRSYAESTRLSCLRLTEGMTLISASGTIGRTVYCRKEMDGMWGSEDVMKVVPDPDKIPPGYLFAFLKSRYGAPLVVSGTYGAIIQHIEPEHLHDIPVPRLSGAVEKGIHNRVSEAGTLRSTAASLRKDFLSDLESFLGWNRMVEKPESTQVPCAGLFRRMDAHFHSAQSRSARDILASTSTSRLIGQVVESCFETGRGKRQKVLSLDYGIPFLSSSEVFSADPIADYLVSKKQQGIEELIVTDQDVLVPRSGQVGGLIGHATLPLPCYIGSAGSEHLVRIRCRNLNDACWVWAVLATEPGYLALASTAFGTSIPSLDAVLVGELEIPWPSSGFRAEIVARILEMRRCLDLAVQNERSAVRIFEDSIAEMVV